jgi:hypothetical protein
MAVLKEQTERFVEVLAVWGDDQRATEPMNLRPGAFDGKVKIQTSATDAYGREVGISDLRTALDLIEEEHRR